MKYLNPFLLKDTLLDIAILLLSTFFIKIGFFMLVKLSFFDFDITKFYNFLHFQICFQKYIYFWNLYFSTFFLTFQEVTCYTLGNKTFFTSCLKNSWFFRRNLRVFHFFMFSFPLAFISSWFYFFVFLFLQIFSLLIAFAHFTVSSLFVRYFVFVLLPQVLRIWENVFYSQAFLPYFPFWFYQGFPGASSSALKVAGLFTEVWNTDPAHLFLWIIQYLAKGITCRFYLRVRGCYGLLHELPFSGFELPILVILIYFLDVIIIH